MKLLERLNIVTRIRRLEGEYSTRRETLKQLKRITRKPPPLPEGDWGILPELRKLRQLAGISEEET